MLQTKRQRGEATEPLNWKADFSRFWASQSISQLAAQTIAAALPLIAISNLGVPDGAVGIISFAQYLPVLLFTLVLGALVDASTKRTTLLIGHFGRAVTFAVLAAVAFAGELTFPILLVAAFIGGALTAAFDVAVQALVPTIVPRERLVFANSRIQLTYSVAQVLGPSLGGIAAAFGRPGLAFGAIAVAYLTAGVIVLSRRFSERIPPRPSGNIWRRTAVGIRYCFRDLVLKTLLTAGAVFNLLEQALIVTFLIYGVRTLGLSVAALGLTLGVSGLGAVVAAVLTVRGRRRNRIITMIIWMSLAMLSPIALLFVKDASVISQLVIAAVFFTYGAGLVVYNIQAVSMRQERADPEMLGRVGAVYRFFAYGALALGGLVSAILTQTLGLTSAMYVLIITMALATIVWVVLVFGLCWCSGCGGSSGRVGLTGAEACRIVSRRHDP